MARRIKMESTIILETERLILRPFTVNDAELAVHNSNCPTVAEAMSDMVMKDTTEAINWIHWINDMSNLESPWEILAIELKNICTCIGLIGVIPQQKIQGEVEILFSICDEYQNRGYATEAANAIIEWFFNSRGKTYLCAIVKTTNIPSQKVIEKLGFIFIEEREIEYDYKPTMFKYYKLQNPQNVQITE